MAAAIEGVEAQHDGVSDFIDQNKDRYIEKLRTLCQQPSVSAQNLGLKDTEELVERFLKETGFKIELFSPTEGPL